jgi:serralysin
MATYNFSTLADGQSVSFRPGSDALRFDQSEISAADVRISVSGSGTRVQIVSGQYAGKDILLLNTTPYQVYTGNVNFASGTRLLNGDNSLSQNDNGSHTLSGTAGRDVFYGYGGNDSMNGGDGNDVFVMARGTASSLGNDSINGGNGFDIVDFSSANASVTGSLAARSVGVTGGGTAFVTAVDGIVGGAFNDNLRGNGATNRLEGGGGNDTLDGASGRNTLVGGSGNDTYIVYAGDVLSDSSGVDSVIAHADWTLASGFENLTLVGLGRDLRGTGNSANNTIIGDDWDNTLRGQGGNDTLDGRGGGDWIDGGSGNDRIFGGDEGAETWFDPLRDRDSIQAGPGNDTISGGGGNDEFVLSGDYGQDLIDGGADQDVLFAGGSRAFVVDLAAGTATGGGSSGSATLVSVEGAAGGRFADRLHGNGADNLFYGRAGNDSISAGGGNDQLLGEEGNDSLTGGAGADEFFFWTPPGAADADLVTDFTSGADQFVLTHFHENVGSFLGDFAAGDERFFAARNASAAHDATDRVIYDTSSGRLYYDQDGTGAAPALIMATLQGAPPLAATDFTAW